MTPKHIYAILIPSYKPDEKLITTIQELRSLTSYPIVVVDDGNTEQLSINVLNQLDQFQNLYLIHHQANLGKGQALKTGIQFVKEELTNVVGIVTADGDGQHLPEDILKVGQALIDNRQALILGTRDFNDPTVPFRSSFGNKITSALFKLVTGQTCSDTQTGLRGIPKSEFNHALETKGSRFEYEMNYLTAVTRNMTPIVSLPISTVYINDNETSHFNPLKDSLTIISILLKFAIFSMISSIVDMSLFAILCYGLLTNTADKVIIATIIARICSGFVNYFLNIKWVFKKQHNQYTFIKYAILFTFLLVLSASLVNFAQQYFTNLVLVKFIVDGYLFILSYHLQKQYVFTESNTRKETTYAIY